MVNYLDLVSMVVNWVTSPCKNIVLLQLLINFFPFFSSQRNKECFNCGERRKKEKEEETEEAREKEKGGIMVVAKGVCVVAMLTTSP